MKSSSREAACPSFDEHDFPSVLRDIEAVLRSGRLILGPQTEALEREFAEMVGTRHAVAVSSCSAALEIALRTLGVAGRAVVVPTNTFVATAVSVKRAGGHVVFAETDPRDLCLDVVDTMSRIDKVSAAAVTVVHLAGLIPHGLVDLMAWCRARDIAVVEDCAHAHGACWGQRAVGAIGDIGCFSFYPTKILTCGVGGMLTTDRDDVADVARSLRHHGQGASLEDIVHEGSDWLMDEVRAVLARAQLARLHQALAHRAKVARAYGDLLAGDSAVTLLRPAPGTTPAWYKYPVLLPPSVDRDAVRRRMQEVHNIATGALYWPPVHRMPVFAPTVAMPVSDQLLLRVLCLPMHVRVDVDDCPEIVSALRECVSTC